MFVADDDDDDDESREEFHDFDRVNPTSVRHIIGQTKVVKQVEVGIDAAHADGMKFDHSLLVGHPGLGKSTVCASSPAKWRARNAS